MRTPRHGLDHGLTDDLRCFVEGQVFHGDELWLEPTIDAASPRTLE